MIQSMLSSYTFQDLSKKASAINHGVGNEVSHMTSVFIGPSSKDNFDDTGEEDIVFMEDDEGYIFMNLQEEVSRMTSMFIGPSSIETLDTTDEDDVVFAGDDDHIPSNLQDEVSHLTSVSIESSSEDTLYATDEQKGNESFHTIDKYPSLKEGILLSNMEANKDMSDDPTVDLNVQDTVDQVSTLGI